MPKSGSCAHLAAAAAIALFLPAGARADDGLKFDEDGLTLETADGNFEMTLGGRLHLDAVSFKDSDFDDETDADVRRARLELSGRIAKIVRFRIDREFANGGGWRNVWLAVEPVKDFEIRGGNVIVPFSMEEIQSSNRSALMERSHVSTLAPGFSLGGMATYGKKHFTVSGGYFGDALDSEDNRSEERGKGFAGRVTFAPMLKKHGFAHLGFAVEHRNLDSGDALRYSADSGGSQLAPTLLETGSMTDINKMTNVGAEAAFSSSSFLVQGQYAKSHLDRDFFNADLSAWYVQASYVLTGEDYEYSKSTGAVSGVNVRRKGGAIEVAARISDIDLKDTNFLAGEGRTYTVGANYYFRRNIRVMANFAHSKAEDVGLTLNDRKVDVVAGRLQIAF